MIKKYKILLSKESNQWIAKIRENRNKNIVIKAEIITILLLKNEYK